MSRGSAKPRTQEQINSTQFGLFQPDSDWKMPTELPQLRGRTKWIGVDLETKDPFLRERGPGWPRGDARIAGVAITAEDGFKQYYPVGHAQGPNLPPNVVFSWLKEQLAGEEEKRGCNMLYDMEGLAYNDVRFNGPLYDVSIVDALCDENLMDYDLEHVSQRRLGRGKNEELLKQAAGMSGFDHKRDMWKMPAKFVGPYAEDDGMLPSLIHDVQQKDVADQDLHRVVKLEHELLYVLLEMRLKGVRVDVEKAEKNRKVMLDMAGVIDEKIHDMIGEYVDVFDTDELASVYERRGVIVPRTKPTKRAPDGNLSITKDWLEELADPFSLLVRRGRQITVTRRNSLEYDVIRDSVGGRIFARFNSVKGEYGDGAESGRFSSSNPNLQKIPHRDEELSDLVRECYIPEEGEVWLKADYAQQEPKWMLHLAKARRLQGVDEVIDKMRANSKLKFYAIITDIVNRVSGKNYSYVLIKTMVLGLMYGMGIKKLAYKLGISSQEAKEIVKCYHIAIPFAKELSDQCMNRAADLGYIRTFSGRRSHFSKWEVASKWRTSEYQFVKSLPLEAAQAEWPGQQLQRTGIHKSLNRVLQGSSADQTKMSMVMLWKEHKKVMSIPVHDELSGSVAGIEQAKTVKYCMENCVQLVLPTVADSGIGPNWARATQPV